MIEQAIDFRDESEALYTLIAAQDDGVFTRNTLFKDWTVDDVIGHLHMFNVAADLSLTDPEGFDAFLAGLMGALKQGRSMRAYTVEWLDGLAGRALLEAWRDTYRPMADRFAAADPKVRVKWAGPDMSVRSSITARLMETWAHGQAVYDLLGVERVDTDRIRNIAHLGVSTFGWTFRNRGMEPPGEPPYVRLTAPSGAVWEWGEPNAASAVRGGATEFCQVVTQTRNVADTGLELVGDIARRWMEIAQCFAGPPEDPPPPGLRRTAA